MRPAWEISADPPGSITAPERAKFKARYGNLAFFGAAQLDDGTMWPTGFAITEISLSDEKMIAELVRKATGQL